MTDDHVPVLLGLRTVIYPAADLNAAKSWYAQVLGVAPYFDKPFYVGFDVGGYELGLLPNGDISAGPVTYWGVANADGALTSLLAAGATVRDNVTDVGGGIRTAAIVTPVGGVLGNIENPSFHAAPIDSPGPGK